MPKKWQRKVIDFTKHPVKTTEAETSRWREDIFPSKNNSKKKESDSHIVEKNEVVEPSILNVEPTVLAIEEPVKTETQNVNIDNVTDSKGLLGEKVKLINGKEVEVKKFLELLYNPDTEEFDYILKMLPFETSEVMKKEVTLKLAYDYYKDTKNFKETNNIVKRIGTSDIFEEYTSFDEQQLYEQEKTLMGEYSYLDISQA